MTTPLTPWRIPRQPPHEGTPMNTDLKHFLRPLVQVIAATLFAVCTVAFVTLPYSLGHIPGDPAVLAQADGPRHLT